MEKELGQILVRAPKEILEELDKERTRERRSRNQQVLYVLQERYNIRPAEQQTETAAA